MSTGPQSELGRAPSAQTISAPHDHDKDKDPHLINAGAVEVDDVPPITLIHEHDPFEIDQNYLAASKWTRFYRSVLCQMLLFGALSFVGPAMTDGINNLGGGGLSSPYLANLANSLSYAGSCVITLIGGPVINKIGIKWACIIAAVSFPLAGYYVSARYGNDAYLLFARILGGLCDGLLYIGETTAMLSYPHQNDKGLYLGIWAAMRNSGSVLGGGINFGSNSDLAKAGGIAWSTYLVFIAFECVGTPLGFLLSPTKKVRRADGTRVPSSKAASWGAEFKALWHHLRHKRTMLIFLPAFYSFFYGGVLGTYLSLNFSVRSRALSSLITPSVTIVLVMLYGRLILDNRRFTLRTRAWMAFLFWAIPQAACFVWFGIEFMKIDREGRVALDYAVHGTRWAEAYLPYLIFFSIGYTCQLSLYWLLGTFSSDVKSSSRTGGLFRAFETLGQAVSYALNSQAGMGKETTMYIMAGLFVALITPMVLLVRMVPENPAEVDDVVHAEVEVEDEGEGGKAVNRA